VFDDIQYLMPDVFEYDDVRVVIRTPWLTSQIYLSGVIFFFWV